MQPGAAEMAHEAELDRQPELIVVRGLGPQEIKVRLTERIVPDQTLAIGWRIKQDGPLVAFEQGSLRHGRPVEVGHQISADSEGLPPSIAWLRHPTNRSLSWTAQRGRNGRVGRSIGPRKSRINLLPKSMWSVIFFVAILVR